MFSVLFLVFTLPCLLLASDSFSINVISATTELIALSLNIKNHLFNEVWYKMKRKDQSDNQLDYKDIPTQKGDIHRPSFFRDCNGNSFSPGTYGILAMIYLDADKSISSEAEINVTIDHPVSLADSDIIITPSSPNAGEEITITLHAKIRLVLNDIINLNPKNIGGDMIFVNITNTCIEGEDFLCHSNTTNTKDILDKPEVIKMEDNHNGIYLAKYTVPPKAGTITMSFYRMENENMIRYQCYTLNSNGTYELGNHFGTKVHNSLPGEDICRDEINGALSRWIGKILIPITKKVTISLDCRPRCDLFIDGESFEATSENNYKSSISKDLEANRMYDIRVEYWESQYSSFQLKWDYLTGFSPIWTDFIWQPAEIKSDDILIKCPPFSYESQDGSCVSSTIRSLNQVQCPDPYCYICFPHDRTVCSECLDGMALTLIAGKCLCTRGQYMRKSSDGSYTCSNCPINTYNDNPGTNTSCIECSNGRYNIQEGSFFCTLNCHKFCSKCFGGNRNQCSECKESETSVTLVGNTCECKSGYYFNSSSNDCLPCDKFCAECTSLTNCTRCKDSKKTISDSGLCECDEGYSEYNEECIKCHIFCKTCTGPSKTECSSCKGGAILTEHRTCSCPPHQYYDPFKRKCERCHPSCSSCIGIEKDSCTNCRENYLFLQGQCIEQCQDGFYLDLSQDKCLPCDSDCETCSSPYECLTCMIL